MTQRHRFYIHVSLNDYLRIRIEFSVSLWDIRFYRRTIIYSDLLMPRLDWIGTFPLNEEICSYTLQ